MKRTATLIIVTMMTAINLMAQTMTRQEVADRLALKNLVDTFSVLADAKDIDTQVQLFTEDGVCDSYSGGSLSSHLVGRDELNKAFTRFLNLFDTVYHQNGQQTVSINGDTAEGTAYCTVVLIGRDQTGKRVMNTQGVIYKDQYKRVDGRWLISHRTSHFVWSDKKVVEQ